MSSRISSLGHNSYDAEGVVRFAPTARNSVRETVDPVDTAGQAILGMLQRAANAAEENSQQAIKIAQKLSRQLQAAEKRIRDLEADVVHYQERAERAETWLHQISQEIEQTFFKSDKRRFDTSSVPSAQSILSLYERRGES